MAASGSINDLLRPLEPRASVEYHEQLTGRLTQHRVEVKQTSDGKGKGVFASQSFREGDVIFEEPPLVAEQQLSCRQAHRVCDSCFRYLGGAEFQAANLAIDLEGASDEAKSRLLGAVAELIDASDTPTEFKKRITGDSSQAWVQACHLPVCDRAYCGQACLEADKMQHGLICPALASTPVRAEALAAFREHAEGTNEIYLLAQKLLAQVLTRADALCQASPQKDPRQALKEAWRPYAVAWKAAWWDCVATPADVGDEVAFRAELKGLAADSLRLLRTAMFDPRFPELFELELYGSIVGMFELNNLALCVPHPLLRLLEATPEPREGGASSTSREPTEIAVEALEELLASGDECTGTAFYGLQSCMNHDCHPNATAQKGPGDADGRAVLRASRDIAPGDEITISYIDEEAPKAERQEALRDYGFMCCCRRCQTEP